MRNIEGAAFDLDGTLYPNYRFNIQLGPFLLSGWRLLWAFGKARTEIRAARERELRATSADTGPAGGFYDRQAEITARILGQDEALVREKIDTLIYRGWEPLFKNIKLFPHVRETLASLKAGGLKLGLLSDFPLKQKLENLGLSAPDLWDAAICSEETGRIKPDPLPFGALADAMGLPPEKIIYVGNSLSYDINGACRAGMKTALVCPRWKASVLNRRAAARAADINAIRTNASQGDINAMRTNAPDFAFYDYRQLEKYVLM
jgi:putative hydrolase of the HAD superfamily